MTTTKIDFDTLYAKRLIDPTDLELLRENPDLSSAIAEKYRRELFEAGQRLKSLRERDGDTPEVRTRTRELTSRWQDLKSAGLIEEVANAY